MTFNLRYSDDCHRPGSNSAAAQKARRAQSLLRAYANAPRGGEGQAIAHALASLQPIPTPREAIQLTDLFPAETQSQALARFSAFLEGQELTPAAPNEDNATRLTYLRNRLQGLLADIHAMPEDVPDWVPVAAQEPARAFQVTPDRPTPPLYLRVRRLAQEAQEAAQGARGFSAVALGKWASIYAILAAHLPENEAREVYSNLVRIFGPAKRYPTNDWKTRQAEGEGRATDADASAEGGAQ